MAFGSWIIEAIVKFNNSSLISGLERSSAAMSAADIRMAQLTGRITAQEAAWHRMSNSVSKARSETNAMINSGAAIGFAAIAAGIGYAADQAARFQRTLIAIKNETGANPRAMGGFYNTIFDISNRMGVSPTEGASVMLDISRLTAGQLSPAQMQAMAPHIADVASAINFNRPEVSVKEATDAILQLVHMNRAYTPDKMLPLADKLYRLMGLMVETPGQAVRQMSYYEPLFKGSGVNTDTEVAVMALLDRAGFRNKVGTGVAASLLEALGPLQLTKHFQQGQGAILTQMGLFRNGKFDVYDKNGNVDYIRMLRDVFNFSQREEKHGATQAEVERLIYGAFGKQGGRVMSLFADPTIAASFSGALDQIVRYLHDPNVSVNAAIKNRNDSVSYQFGRAVSNLNAVMIELGYPWLTDLAHFFKGLADNLHGFQEWLHSHRDAEKVIGGVVTAIGAFLGTVATVGAAAQLLRFLGIIEELPNAFMLTLAPLRFFMAGIGWFATSGIVADAATAIGGLGLSIATLPAAAFAASAAIAALLVLLATAKTQKDFDASNPQELNYELQRAKKYCWGGLDPQERKNLWGKGLRPSQFPMPKSGPEVPRHSLPPTHVSVNVHPGAVQVHGVTNAKQIADLLPQAIKIALADPRSLIGSFPQNGNASIPLPLVTKPA